jgi:hypothetical protein
MYPPPAQPPIEEEKPTKKKKHGKKSKKKDVVNHRYLIRIVKGSILPILYALMSIYMLQKYVLEYPKEYDYEVIILAIGFVLGLGTMSGMALVNMLRAKKKARTGIELHLKTGFIIYAPIFVIFVVLALFWGIATVWQFSIGFFATAIFPLLLVLLIELTSKGKFFVQETLEGAGKGNRLVFITNKKE